MNKHARALFMSRLAQHIQNPTTELIYSNIYQLLVAVVLSAQTTDKAVNKATYALFAQVHTPQQMCALGEATLKEHIKTIGLYNAKARHIIALSKQLLQHHGGEVPNSRTALQSLPGVGRKTVNVILNTAFGQPTIAVDTHIFRLGNRTGLAAGHTPLAVENKLIKLLPKEHLLAAHHLLILHGRYTCTAHKPKCATCVVADVCDYAKQVAKRTHGKLSHSV